MKLRRYIKRDKIKRELFKEEIKEYNELIKTVKKLENNYDMLKGLANNSIQMFNEARHDMNHSTEIAEQCRKTMNSICDVGVDIGIHDKYHSWAVVCIHGKTDFVKFVPLTHHDVIDVAKYLKRFEYSKMSVDSPFAYKDIIKDYIFKE